MGAWSVALRLCVVVRADLVRLLVAARGSTNTADSDRETPLYVAASK